MCQLVERLDVRGRRIVVLTAPGDRRDEDIARSAQIAAGHFDHYVCRRDDNPRGREPDEVPQLLARRCWRTACRPTQITIIPDEQEAVDAALAMARAQRPGADLRATT